MKAQNWIGLSALAFVAACGPLDDRDLTVLGRGIVYGQTDSNPAHAAVVAITFGSYLCSGTLISSDVVLTAAHCASGYGPANFTIHFGSNVGTAETRAVSEVKVHPSWNPNTITHDLALLRLASAAPNHVTPIPFLPHALQIDQADVNQALEFVGFGQTEYGQAGTKLTVHNDLNWICTQPGGCTVGSGYHASENTLCGDQSPGGPCHGDSGGPAFVFRAGQEYVAGVTSYGDQNCQYFGCSVKVDEYETFIADFVGGTLGSSCNKGADCLSGICADGVCCGSACDQACMACNLPGSRGVCSPAPNGASCSDGDPCNGEEVCLIQECVSGEPLSCADENPCTDDACVPGQGCAFAPLPDGFSCADQDACNGAEVCQAGACQPVAPLSCEDDNPCTTSTCDPLLGCVPIDLADGTNCGGGACGPAICNSGACLPANSAFCDDGDACTLDRCDEVGGCINEPLPDGAACGGCAMCQAGACELDPECELQGGCNTIATKPSQALPAWIALLGLLFLAPIRRTRFVLLALMISTGIATGCGAEAACYPTGNPGSCCASDEDCGDDLTCLHDFPGGSCTRDCSEDQRCPDGSHCLAYQTSAQPEALTICMVGCASGQAPCRDDYACTLVDFLELPVCVP